MENAINLIRPDSVQRKLTGHIGKERLAANGLNNICDFVSQGPGLDKTVP
jgi:nucleoside diphosphate kinase